MARRPFAAAALLIAFMIPAYADNPERDFSGEWIMDPQASEHVPAAGEIEARITIAQSRAAILCTTDRGQWSYTLDGSESRQRIGGESKNSVTKWEGSAPLINTLVSGPRNYTVMDRWKLSRDRTTLRIRRQIAGGEVEGTLVFQRQGLPATAAGSEPRTTPPSTDGAGTGNAPLAARPEPAALPDATVPSGTHVLLELVGEVSTKHARDCDRVYLRTAAPVAGGGKIIIPRGSDVQGTITRAKAAGRVSGMRELYLRFDSLILPNGVSRDFHARPSGGEGKVAGEGKATDGRTVMMGTGVGASIGGLSRGLPGAAVGAAVGAIAGVLLSRNQDVVLRSGTHVEMILDRDLVFHFDEIPGALR